MEKTKNLYDQQVDDFLCRARSRLGELVAGLGDCGCSCAELLAMDLRAAIRTLSNPYGCLTDAERMRLVQVMTSRAGIGCAAPGGGTGVVVREGASCCSGNGAGITLPLTGEQVIVVTPGGITKNLQTVINELYNQQGVYYIDGGSATPNFHPSIP